MVAQSNYKSVCRHNESHYAYTIIVDFSNELVAFIKWVPHLHVDVSQSNYKLIYRHNESHYVDMTVIDFSNDLVVFIKWGSSSPFRYIIG